jgi:predicted HTH domain antitoxin
VEAAIQLFREGEVTLGRAAEIAGLTRWEFDTLLADRGIDRGMECDPVEELESQVQTLLAEA